MDEVNCCASSVYCGMAVFRTDVRGIHWQWQHLNDITELHDSLHVLSEIKWSNSLLRPVRPSNTAVI